MSDPKDHPHDHDHGHEHPHDHPHDHHGSSAGEGAAIDDAGTVALSDALKSSFVIVRVIMAALVVLFIFSGVFQVRQGERAVVFRFGRPRGDAEKQLLGPGLHWSWPAPIDQVEKIPIGEIQTVSSTVGWYFNTADNEARGEDPPPSSRLIPLRDGYVLTADGNILHARVTIRYRITDPITHLFRFESSSNAVQNALDNSVVYAAAKYTVDQALRLDVAGFKERIVGRFNDLVAQQNLGVTLELPEVRVSPPIMVKPAFEEVGAAEQERDKLINEAVGYQKAMLATTGSEVSSITNHGRVAASRLVQTVQAEAKYFTNVLASYEKNPEFSRQRLLTEKWQTILTNAQEKWVWPEGPEMRLLLSKLPPKPSTGQTNQAR